MRHKVKVDVDRAANGGSRAGISYDYPSFEISMMNLQGQRRSATHCYDRSTNSA